MQKDAVNYLENKRTIFNLNDKGVNHSKFIFGFIVYFIVFVVFIPYLLIQNSAWEILSAYFPNLDIMATILGYHGGPLDSFIWTHLYNPTGSTLTGYISSNLINLFALLGVTYIIAHYTLINNNIYKGWARAFIMLPMTYFLPGNFIVYFMNILGNYLNKFASSKSIMHYLLVTSFGLLVAIGIILGEAFLLNVLVPYIVKILKIIY